MEETVTVSGTLIHIAEIRNNYTNIKTYFYFLSFLNIDMELK